MVEASLVVGDLLNLVDGSLRGAGQVVAFDLSASVVFEIWAAGGPGQDCDVRPVAMPPGYSWAPVPVDGYRPGRRAQDAIAEIHQLTSRSYEWVVEGDITACFDNVDHQILMDLVGERITDRKVLRLVRGFLWAGILQQHGGLVASFTGTPPGGVASPLLANIYLSVLDRHFATVWEQDMRPPWRRAHRRRKGCRTTV